MNINELADCIEFDAPIMGINKEAATMLRQQQERIKQLEKTQEYLYKTHDADKAEIEALKAAKIRAYNNGVEDGRKPDTNNEPVAWMHQNPDYAISKHQSLEYNIPLYTHPVKELDEQFKKGFEAGKEEGWKAHKFHHPVEEQDESFDRTASHMAGEYVAYKAELTDEEIYKLYEESYLEISPTTSEFDPVYFARAILRKVQEK